jgi:Spy/CpxP family protein refolding chaperone
MKKIIVGALVLSIAAGVNAQEIPERKAERPAIHERMKGREGHAGMDFKSLNLTAEQKEKFKSQNENFRKQMEELKKNEGITVKEWRSKMEDLRKDHKARMEGLLTADQKAQLEKQKVEGKAKFEARAKERADNMKTRLGLTDEQSAKLEKSRQQAGADIKAIRDNKSLDEEKKREQIKELMKKQKENMKSILTEEQLKKLKEAREQGHERNGKRPEKKETI